ncbi:hypothetical protein AAFF_G00390360 [Aldrovandia affinis]|uniref:Uncharacterized protein n=1 Tax=Aldrovandia affinis TaxID=143900 RepID=A0AAD7SEF7_9TELE|nr:hypothetical protein AAFF_G00390360 [Aldrovandia affinis]
MPLQQVQQVFPLTVCLRPVVLPHGCICACKGSVLLVRSVNSPPLPEPGAPVAQIARCLRRARTPALSGQYHRRNNTGPALSAARG